MLTVDNVVVRFPKPHSQLIFKKNIKRFYMVLRFRFAKGHVWESWGNRAVERVR